MTSKLKKSLHQHEALVKSDKIRTFKVFIQQEGVLILAAGSDAGQEVPLIQEMLTSFRTFFYGVECIEYGTYDYDSLKGFVNANTGTGGETR